MGRGRKARTTAGPSVVGATPATEGQPFVISLQQRQAAQEDVLGVDAEVRKKQPATLKPVSFFTAPPRTEIFEERDDDGGDKDMAFKKRAAAAAPANLGEISGMIWAKTSRVRGGAKDPEAAPAARVGHVMEELALLDEGGDEAALMSADGFKAYADDSIWGVRAPGEADDAPLDVEDAIQVKNRLQQVWANWRNLTPQQQRTWAEKQLGKEGAAAVKRATGKAAPKARGSLWSAESTAALKAVGAYSSRKKPDGWTFSRARAHTGRSGREAAAELDALQEQQKDAADAAGKQAGSSADQRKQKKRARKQAEAEAAAAAERQRELQAEIAEAQWRRAAALRRSRPALLAEMAVWEKEAEETEAAAAAGITVEELRKQRKEQEVAEAAAAEADRREQEREEEDAAEQEGNEEEGADAAAAAAGGAVGRRGRAKAPAATAKAAGSKGKKNTAVTTAAAEAGAAGPSSSKSRGKLAAAAAAPAAAASAGTKPVKGRKAAAAKASRKKPLDPYEMEVDSDEEDEDAPGAEEEAELARALSDGDDSDADANSESQEDEEEEEEAPVAAPPAKKRAGPGAFKPMGPKAALAAAAAALAKRAASVLGAAGTSKQPKPAAAGAAAAEQGTKGAGRKGAGKKAAAAAAGAAEGAKEAASPSKGKSGGRKAKKDAETEPQAGKAGGSRKRPAAAVPEAADADAPSGAGLSGRSKRRKQQGPTSSAGAGAGPSGLQASPVRRSGRQTAQAADDAEGPTVSGAAAVSGAGPSIANRSGRPTPAGTAQAAQMEELEMKMFSNTRRKSLNNPSFSRGDSPGLVPNSAQGKKKGSSRLNKRKAAA